MSKLLIISNYVENIQPKKIVLHESRGHRSRNVSFFVNFLSDIILAVTETGVGTYLSTSEAYLRAYETFMIELLGEKSYRQKPVNFNLRKTPP